jgi:hypothetical protein
LDAAFARLKAKVLLSATERDDAVLQAVSLRTLENLRQRLTADPEWAASLLDNHPEPSPSPQP